MILQIRAMDCHIAYVLSSVHRHKLQSNHSTVPMTPMRHQLGKILSFICCQRIYTVFQLGQPLFPSMKMFKNIQIKIVILPLGSGPVGSGVVEPSGCTGQLPSLQI